MKKSLVLATAGLVMAFGVQMQAYAMQGNTVRPGATYRSFNLRTTAPAICQRACLNDRRCRSWTYVKPYTLYGARPRCLLKKAVPRARRDRCCVTGVKTWRRHRRY
ncbi:MAG: PAN domain-containing protein [Candidatus Competibacteraceae bacterium]|nr:PAN domain-containing protein [Candidatus Competibacteraceae bacterium]